MYRILTVLHPLICRLHIEGAENIPPSGGCIVTCNHSAGPDYFFLGYASPRQIFYMAKSEAFDWHPWIGKFLTAYGVFPIRRGQGDVDAIQFAAELVKGGRILGMFPEGTRSRTGVLRQGKSGVARIALMSQAPVVPGVVLNSLETLKKLGRPWQRPEVYVRFGEPLIFDGDPGNREVVYATLHRIMVETARMMPAQLRGEWGQFVE